MDIMTIVILKLLCFYKSRNSKMKQESTIFWSIDEDLILRMCLLELPQHIA